MKVNQEIPDQLVMINLGHQHELEYWAKELEITTTTLKIAAKK